jgi:hypothetical protein
MWYLETSIFDEASNLMTEAREKALDSRVNPAASAAAATPKEID